MLQLRRRIGEAFIVGDVLITHVLLDGRHGLRIDAPGHESFTLFVGTPASQLRIGIVADYSDITRIDEPVKRAPKMRVFDPS